ncbi:hypothetical protein [Streptomyces sp. NPDC001770]
MPHEVKNLSGPPSPQPFRRHLGQMPGSARPAADRTAGSDRSCSEDGGGRAAVLLAIDDVGPVTA